MQAKIEQLEMEKGQLYSTIDDLTEENKKLRNKVEELELIKDENTAVMGNLTKENETLIKDNQFMREKLTQMKIARQ